MVEELHFDLNTIVNILKYVLDDNSLSLVVDYKSLFSATCDHGSNKL